MNASLPWIEERPFDVDSEHSWHLRCDRRASCLKRCGDLGRTIADESGQEASRAEAAMCTANRRNGFDAWIIIEQAISAAIHLNVNEARDESPTLKIDDCSVGWKVVAAHDR
jgi:hypothetical protein